MKNFKTVKLELLKEIYERKNNRNSVIKSTINQYEI